MKTKIDLFKVPELLPENVQAIVNKYAEMEAEGDFDYKDCSEFFKEMNAEGYTFESYLDNVPYNLEPILFPRKCDCCGKGMEAGFIIGEGVAYYCSEECLGKAFLPDEIEELDLGEDNSPNYYTEWDELDEDFNFKEDGTQVDMHFEEYRLVHHFMTDLLLKKWINEDNFKNIYDSKDDWNPLMELVQKLKDSFKGDDQACDKLDEALLQLEKEEVYNESVKLIYKYYEEN